MPTAEIYEPIAASWHDVRVPPGGDQVDGVAARLVARGGDEPGP